MAEECTSGVVPPTKEEDAPMDCETSEPESIKADITSEKDASSLPASGATTAAASTPATDSESAMNPEDARMKEEVLAVPFSGATSAAASAAASASVSDSECPMSSEDSNVKAEALKLSASGVTPAAASTSVSDSGCAMSPCVRVGASTVQVSGAAFADVSEAVEGSDDTHAKEAADPSGSKDASVPAPASGSTTDDPKYLSAQKVSDVMHQYRKDQEKAGLLRGVKDAIKTKAKSLIKKLSPKKPEKASLAASAQDEESMEATETVKKPIKAVAYVSASRGSLELNSVASDEVTFDTDVPASSSSDVFQPDQASIGSCDTETHASRLPSLADSSVESPEHKAEESSGDRGEEAMDDGNVCLGESPEHKAEESAGNRGDETMDDGNVEESS